MREWAIEKYINPPHRTAQMWEASDQEFARLISIHVLNNDAAQRLQLLHNMDHVGGTLLHYAARSGLVNVVVCLLRAKVDANRVRRQPPREDFRIAAFARFAGTGTALDLATSRRGKLLQRGRRNEGIWRTSGELSSLIMGRAGVLQLADLKMLVDYEFSVDNFTKVEQLLTD